MQVLSIMNIVLVILFSLFSYYQLMYVILGTLKKKKIHAGEGKRNRFGVLIAARNEEMVIGNLIDSIVRQDYPRELVDIFVIADNCTDSTAAVAAEHGAIVYERHNKEKVGKCYAMEALLHHIKEDYPETHYDGFFVFDADNLIAEDYISEMNRVFSEGYKIVTGYRNTKNFSDNWITAGYGIYFMRESCQMNSSREYIGSSCFVSGTGYMFASELLGEDGEWKWFTLTEDLEFSADMIIRGEKIAYCGTAELFDEQPTKLHASFVQRARWIRGYFQVIRRYGKGLWRCIVKDHNFACYDMLINMTPIILTIFTLLTNIIMLILGLTVERENMVAGVVGALLGIFGAYLVMFIFGMCATITEWNKIHTSNGRKILSMFTFPLFIFTFFVAFFMAMFSKPQWKRIEHNVALSIDDMNVNKQEEKAKE